MDSGPSSTADARLGAFTSAMGSMTTLVGRPASQGGEAALQLLVLEPGALSAHPLPAAGSVTIGRAEECDVRLRDGSVSRRHACIHTGPLSIEDCGSANGTRIGHFMLGRAGRKTLHLGEPISVGNSLLLVRHADPDAAPVARARPVSATRLKGREKAVVADPIMTRLYETIDRIADAPINVLVLGETGVGKELVAEAIHERSCRRGAPMVRINCAALSESLLESELFGHERGAFTGAVASKPGLLEAADRGTVFLDEVGDMTPNLQAKLLRAIEAREVQRIGSLRTRAIDVRFVAATNRDLSTEVTRRSFRADLFFRLNGVCLDVPPLRQRAGDIVALARTFAAGAARRVGIPTPELTPDAIASLLAHSWPGNVRELKNAIERAVVLSNRGQIGASDLFLFEFAMARPPTASELAGLTMRPPRLASMAPGEDPTDHRTLGPLRAGSSDERARIIEALSACHGNQTRAAKRLGMPRRTFVAKLGHYGLPRPRKP